MHGMRSKRAKTCYFFCFQLGMPKKDHASERLSRKAMRLDGRERRGTLAYAKLKASLFSHFLFLHSQLVILGLDIEGLLS